MKKLYISKIADIVYSCLTINYQASYNYIYDEIFESFNYNNVIVYYDESVNESYIMINENDEETIINNFVESFLLK